MSSVPELSFSGVIDHVSKVLLPYGTTFSSAAGQSVAIGMISAIALSLDASTLYALSDRATLSIANIEFDGLARRRRRDDGRRLHVHV